MVGKSKIIALSLIMLVSCSYNIKYNRQSIEPVSAETVIEEIEEEENIEDKIIAASKAYDVDPRLAVAISRLETGHFKSKAYRIGNNVGGLSVDEVPLSFETLDEGVVAFVENLSTNYIEQGLTNPYEIGYKYCPLNPQGWADMVTAIMQGRY